MTGVSATDRATGLAKAYPGWVVWTKRPVATRAAAGRAPRRDGTWAATLVCDSWAELEAKLAEQAANEEAHA